MNLSINLDICRVCMKAKKCQKILADTALNKKWLYTTHLPLDQNDNLPKQLCENCIARLKISYDFIHSAQTSEKNLKAFLKKIQKDFNDVANAKFVEKTDDEDEDAIESIEDADDLLALIRPEKSEEDGSAQKSPKYTENDTKPLTQKNKLKISTTQLKKNDEDYQMNTPLIKNEKEPETETETETQEFEVAIDQCDEGYHLYDGVNFVDSIEGYESRDAMNEPVISTKNIDIEEIQVQEYEVNDENGLSCETSSQNDETPIRINNSGDGFLKEYEGSLSDGGNETIDYIDEVSLQDIRNSECEEGQPDSGLAEEPKKFNDDYDFEEQSYELNYSTDGEEKEKPKSSRKNLTGRKASNLAGGKGRSTLPASTRFLCVKCNRDFSTKTNLNRHMITHEGVKPYKCKECNKSFTQNGSLKQHMLIHTGEKPFVCDFCNRGFNQSKSLVFHLRRHTGEKPFHCEFCGLDFRQKDGLKNHISRHHMSESVGNKFLCIVCKKVLNNKSELQLHMKKHVNNHKSSSFSEYPRTGEQNAELVLELLNENEEYRAESTTIYPEEMSLSLNNITNATHVVDLMSTSAAEPSRAKKYQCRKCFKCFAIKKNLIRHLTIHDMTVSEMFQCKTCQIAFDTNYALNLHLVRDHKQVVDNLNKCEECHLVFDTAAELNKHMDECHQYLCAECPDQHFKTQKMLMDHMLEHELEDAEVLKLT